MDEKTYAELLKMFESTVSNCTIYLSTNKTKSFINEVGTGKGLLYAFSAVDKLPNGEAMNLFATYVQKVQELLKEERRSLFR